MKQCIKCGVNKPIDCFYKNKNNKDGKSNKCSECTKKYRKELYEKHRKDPNMVEKIRAWSRNTYHRCNYKNKYRPNKDLKHKRGKEYRNKYPEKYKAQNATAKIKPEEKGNHLHHWCYKKEYHKDVIELSPNNHAFIHRYMDYDQKNMVYCVATDVIGFQFGEPLDTKAKHCAFISTILILK